MSKNGNYNWECVVWYSSLGSVQQLADFSVKGYLSPLHNLDGGDFHYHWILCFDREKSYNQVMQMLREDRLAKPEDYEGEDVFPINTVKYVRDMTTRARYLCHLDETNKAHYDINQVRCFGGMDYSKYLNYTTDKVEDDLSLFQIIRKYNCTSYSQLVRYCAYVSKTYYKSVVGRCGFWSAYLRSLGMDSRSAEMENIIIEKEGMKYES